jgi:hypothetical protein
MMQTQLLKVYPDVPDGLFLLADNYKIQDTLVDFIGIVTPPLSTGVVQK